MISGNFSLPLDIPPYLLVLECNKVDGLNLLGIKHRGFKQKDIGGLQACFYSVFSEHSHPYKKAAEAKERSLGTILLGSTLLKFVEKKGKRCVQGRQLVRQGEPALA